MPTARSAAGLWARTDFRRRWRSLMALALLAGVTAGVVLAALAGARRTTTALARLRTKTNAADAVVFSSQVGVQRPNWSRLAARPEIEQLAVWSLVFGTVDGEPGEATLFAANDRTYLGSVDRPVVVAGRMFDPAAPDEMVVDENLAKDAPLGTVATFHAYGPGQADSSGAPPTGATVQLHVVGVVREVPEFLFVSNGQGFLSPGFLAHYGSEVDPYENASVRLVHGAADVPALQRDVNTLVAPGVPVLDIHAVSRRVDTTLSVEHAALLLLALVVAIAGGLLVGQALVRSASTVADDAATLRAVGMTRTDLAAATGVSHVFVAVLTSVVAFAAAVGLSRWFPVGLGRRIDPDVGIHIDWVVLVPGALLAGLIVFAVGTIAAVRAASAQRRHAGSALPGLAARVARWAPLTVGLSTTMAFGRRPGQARVAARPAVIAAVVAVAGIVGALTIEQGVDDALTHPARAGVAWDAYVIPTTNDLTATGVSPDLESRVAAASGPGAALAVVTRDLVDVDSIGVPTFTVRPSQGEASTPIELKLTAGRAPADLGEAAIGPATARELRVHAGDTVTVGSHGATVRIVGEALFPNDVHSEFDEGLWVSPAQLDAVLPPPQQGEQASVDRAIVVRVPPGADKDAALQRLTSEVGSRADVEPADIPDELTNLRNVRALPLFLAGFLALLAVGALSHVLLGSARRRRRDFAVLRALGMTRRQSRLVLNSLGTTIALIGVVVGVPLGIAIGRAGWRLVTERVPLVDVAPFAALAVVLVLPATLLAANALAVWPGGVVARRRMPAQVLRTE